MVCNIGEEKKQKKMIAQKLYKKIISMRDEYINHITYKAEIRNIERKKSLWSKVVLTPEQEEEIKIYWKENAGISIDTRWHRLYQSYMGVYEKKYFPEILYSTKVEPIISPAKYHGILSDKGLLKTIFQGDSFYRLPYTHIYNSNGIIIDDKYTVLSNDEALKRFENCGKVIIKPTVNTSSGIGVMMLEMHNGVDERTGKSAYEIIKSYNKDYIVQEYVKQSRYLANIYAGSLNTFRVVTYICEGKIYLAPIALRIGSGGSFVDNLHAGGMSIGIKGCTLREYAFTEMGQKYEKHPDSGLLFNGYEIPAIKKITEAALSLHGRLPQLGMISWDWSIDIDEKPIMVEMNISGQSVWFPQMLNGQAMFGEQTEYFAHLIRDKEKKNCF